MRFALVLLLVLCCGGLVAHAEMPYKSKAQLLEASTHVIHGTVRAIYERTAMHGDMRTTYYVAEVSIHAGAEGLELQTGELAYVRYWRRAWTGTQPAPVGGYGHKELPKVGETLRIYLRKNAKGGPLGHAAGGFDVVLPNGFERMPEGK
jgi:hypothetical protein